MTTPGLMACAICARHLITITATDPHGAAHIIHTHQDATDHRAVPVTPRAIHTQDACDFCGGPDPAWTLPVRDFTIRGHASVIAVGDWLACHTCATYIRADRWLAMAHHAAHVANRSHNREPNRHRDGKVAASLLNGWALVRDNTTGPLRAVEEATP